MKLADAYQQGGKILRISTHEGDVVKTYVLDRPIAGIYVDSPRRKSIPFRTHFKLGFTIPTQFSYMLL